MKVKFKDKAGASYLTVLSEKTRTSADERLKGDLDYKFPANKMFFSAFTLSNFRKCWVARAGTNIMIFSSIPEAELHASSLEADWIISFQKSQSFCDHLACPNFNPSSEWYKSGIDPEILPLLTE